MNKSNNPMLGDPLDELFGTPPTEIAKYEQVTEGELAEMAAEEAPPEKDAEDLEIDKKIDTIYDAALDAFNTQTQYTEIIEPRYAARNAEVAANYLSLALNAVATRAKVKGERKRQASFVPYANKSGATVITASREEIMAMFSRDAEFKGGE